MNTALETREKALGFSHIFSEKYQRERNEHKKYKKKGWSQNSLFNENYNFKNPRSPPSPKKEKHKEIHIKTCYNQLKSKMIRKT